MEAGELKMIRKEIRPDFDVCEVCGADIKRIYSNLPGVMWFDNCLNKNCGFVCHGLTNQYFIFEKSREYRESNKPIEYSEN